MLVASECELEPGDTLARFRGAEYEPITFIHLHSVVAGSLDDLKAGDIMPPGEFEGLHTLALDLPNCVTNLDRLVIWATAVKFHAVNSLDALLILEELNLVERLLSSCKQNVLVPLYLL